MAYPLIVFVTRTRVRISSSHGGGVPIRANRSLLPKRALIRRKNHEKRKVMGAAQDSISPAIFRVEIEN
eukprot:1361648-Amorphochlora_amoeboformis.AAC.1